MNKYRVWFYKDDPRYAMPQYDEKLSVDFTDADREIKKIIVASMLKSNIAEIHVTLMPNGKYVFPVRQIIYIRDEQQPSKWELYYDKDERWPELNILGMNVTDIYEQA